MSNVIVVKNPLTNDSCDKAVYYAKRLLIKDLLKIFDNYESSKCLLWEIVRTFHPIHTAALLFCMENITKSYKTNTLTIKTETPAQLTGNLNHLEKYNDVRLTEINEFTTLPQPGVVLCCMRPTLRLQQCERDYINLPNFKDMLNVTAERDQFGDLTIFGLIRMLQTRSTTLDDNETSCTVYERIVMHNLRTQMYTQFSQNILHHLLPEHMQQPRHEALSENNRTMTSDNNESCMHMKFIQFYESIYNVDMPIHQESRTFRQINRPRPVYIYEKPANLYDYYVQPRYVGYNVVINATKTNTRTYNRYGELLHSVLYQKKFPLHATFEAMLVPLDESGRPRSWRYSRSPNTRASILKPASTVMGCSGIMTCQNFILYVVDVFRVRDKLLINEPFHKRIRYARLLECENVYVCNTCYGYDRGHVLWDTLERGHNDLVTLDPFAPINGIVLRGKNDIAVRKSKQYVFSSNVIYNFQKNALTQVSGDCSMRLALDSYFSPAMAEQCTVVTIYAHDDQFYYVCRFDRNLFTFVHDVCLDRVCDIWRTHLRYTKDKVYIRDAKLIPMGIAFLRIYHNDNRNFKNMRLDSRRTIIAYESKITTSIYDVPFKRTLWFV